MARCGVIEAAAAMGGRVIAGDPGGSFAGAAIDSRKVQGGDVFFALAGMRTDGHRFVAGALAGGAAAVVVQRPVEAPSAASMPGRAASGPAIIQVEDTFRALHDLARHVRRRVPERLVGLTGSAGKTTTKELLAAMLAARFRVAKTPGNLNNLYGFPLSLLNVPDDAEWMVAEMGMSEPGELAELSQLGRPDVALFTVVRPVHLEFFASLRAIAEAKAELLTGLAPGGLVIANADDPEVSRIAGRHSGRGGNIVWYGIESASADVRAVDISPAPGGEVGSRFRVVASGPAGTESADFALPLHGLYNVGNCLAAAACAWAIGVPLAAAAAAIADVRPASMRGVVHRLAGGLTVIDDSYNSNPDAVARALEGAALLAAGRRMAVLGDMLELGPEGPRFHREAGELAARAGFATVVGVGELSRELVAAAKGAGAEALWFPDAAAAALWARGAVSGGDLVLVKGSRGVGLEAVVHALLAGAGDEAGTSVEAEAH